MLVVRPTFQCFFLFFFWKNLLSIKISIVAGHFSSNYKITIGADFSVKTLQWDQETKLTIQLW